MYLLGATLTKLLATLAAVMTVTAGLPSFQCRCPDGRVKLLCHGGTSSPAGCCCSAESSASSAASCCSAKKAGVRRAGAVKTRSCCARSHGESQRQTGDDGHRLGVKGCCCVKAATAAPAVYSVEHTGGPTDQPADVPAFRETAAAPPHVTSAAAALRCGPRADGPDLAVLCHFTC